MKAKLKAIASYVLPGLVVFGFLNAIYEWGYYRGYSRGSVAMRDAIMCVIEQTGRIPPYKYCSKQEAARK